MLDVVLKNVYTWVRAFFKRYFLILEFKDQFKNVVTLKTPTIPSEMEHAKKVEQTMASLCDGSLHYMGGTLQHSSQEHHQQFSSYKFGNKSNTQLQMDVMEKVSITLGQCILLGAVSTRPHITINYLNMHLPLQQLVSPGAAGNDACRFKAAEGKIRTKSGTSDGYGFCYTLSTWNPQRAQVESQIERISATVSNDTIILTQIKIGLDTWFARLLTLMTPQGDV